MCGRHLFAVHKNQLSIKDVKDKVFVPPFPASLEELWTWITEVVTATDADMIHRICNEIAYRWDICCVTRGNHIEHLCISVDKT
jgi:hypothetical protein